ncbi:MAG: response regulator transcription factor, partial [bacterium]
MEAKKKILVVDDEASVVKLIRFLLEKHGFEIYIAYDGQESVEVAEQVLPDLIIMDIMMPKMDGIEAMKILKKKDSTKDIPMIVLSALGQEGEVATGLESGAMDYLVKPFNPKDLLERVNNVLGKK